MPDRGTLQQLWPTCPKLHRLLLTNSSTLSDEALDELEGFVVSVLKHEKRLTDNLTYAERELDRSHVALKKILAYTRLLQIVLSRVHQGKIDSPLRVAISHIAGGWKVHRTALALGAPSLDSINSHVNALMHKATTYLGITLTELEAMVFDSEHAGDGDPPPQDSSPFKASVEHFKTGPASRPPW